MSNLSVFDKDGIEILINTETGESFCSVSGYARMSGKAKSTVFSRLEAVQNLSTKNAEIDTAKGLRTVRLIDEDLISDWIVDDNPSIAKQLLKVGVRVFLHKAAGYEVTSTAVAAQASVVDSTIANAKSVAQYLKQVGVESAIADSLVLDAVANQFPELKGMTEMGKRLLSVATPLESVGLTPTEIGEQLNPPVNAKVVNSALEALGLQEKGTRQSTKTGKDKSYWKTTEAGKQYGHVYLATGGNNWTGGQIRWQESVIPLVQTHLVQS